MGSAGFGALASSRTGRPGLVAASPIRPTPSYPIGTSHALSQLDVFGSSRPSSAANLPMRSSGSTAAQLLSEPRDAPSLRTSTQIGSVTPTKAPAHTRANATPDRSASAQPLQGQSSSVRVHEARSNPAGGEVESAGGSPRAGIASHAPAVESKAGAAKARSAGGEGSSGSARGTTDAELRALAALSTGGRIASGLGAAADRLPMIPAAPACKPQWAGPTTSPPASPDPAQSPQLHMVCTPTCAW